MKKLLIAIASTLVLNLGFTSNAGAGMFTPKEESNEESVFPETTEPSFPTYEELKLEYPDVPDVVDLLKDPKEVSVSEGQKSWCKITDPVAAALALSDSAKVCVANSPQQAASRLTTFLMGNPDPAIEAAICLKNGYPDDYYKALEYVEITSDCKVYGD
ncbi:MAG: hypothetical protein VKJ25_23400 [Okeania sp.]|nr:hypothetical protein [Okeania sp.]